MRTKEEINDKIQELEERKLGLCEGGKVRWNRAINELKWFLDDYDTKN